MPEEQHVHVIKINVMDHDEDIENIVGLSMVQPVPDQLMYQGLVQSYANPSLREEGVETPPGIPERMPPGLHIANLAGMMACAVVKLIHARREIAELKGQS